MKEKNSIMPLARMFLRKHPVILEIMAGRHEIYNGTVQYIRQQEECGTIFLICPAEKLPVGHIEHDPQILRRVYEVGRRTMEAQLEALKAFIGEL